MPLVSYNYLLRPSSPASPLFSQGLSTDTVADVLRLVQDRPETYTLSSFKLFAPAPSTAASATVALPETLSLASLLRSNGSPTTLEVVHVAYAGRAALLSHARRLREVLEAAGPMRMAGEENVNFKAGPSPRDAGVDGGALCAPPRLGGFYSFFSAQGHGGGIPLSPPPHPGAAASKAAPAAAAAAPPAPPPCKWP